MLPGQEVKCRMREESSRPLPTSAPHSLEVDQETEVAWQTLTTTQPSILFSDGEPREAGDDTEEPRGRPWDGDHWWARAQPAHHHLRDLPRHCRRPVQQGELFKSI